MKASDEKSRDILFSLSYGMFPLASTLGSFLAGYLPGMFRNVFGITSSASAYQAALLLAVFASFMALIPLAFICEKKAALVGAVEGQEPAQVDRPNVWKVFFRPLTLKLAIPNLVIGFGAATLVPYFNVFFSERHQMSDAALGMLFSLGSLITGIGCIIGPRLVGNLGGKIRTVVLGQTASLGFLLLIGFSPWAWLAAIGFLARGALMNMVAPLFDAFALELTHETEHGAVNSIRNLAWNVGWAVGPYISGLVQQRWGFSPLFISTAVLYGVASSLTWIFFRPKAGRDLQTVLENGSRT
jgi:predicted MFS family arabinose efflux permease